MGGTPTGVAGGITTDCSAIPPSWPPPRGGRDASRERRSLLPSPVRGGVGENPDGRGGGNPDAAGVGPCGSDPVHQARQGRTWGRTCRARPLGEDPRRGNPDRRSKERGRASMPLDGADDLTQAVEKQRPRLRNGEGVLAVPALALTMPGRGVLPVWHRPRRDPRGGWRDGGWGRLIHGNALATRGRRTGPELGEAGRSFCFCS